MRNIEDARHRPGQALESTGQAHARQTGTHGGVVDRERRGQQTQRHQRAGGVTILVLAGEPGGRQRVDAPVRPLPCPARRRRRGGDREVMTETMQVRAAFRGNAQQSGRRRRIGTDRRPVRAKDAGLLGADRVAVRAEPFLVIEADRGHQRDIGINDIDRIQPAAKTDLEDRDIRPRAREQVERGQRAEFEIAETDVAARRIDAGKRGAQRVVIGLAAGDAHPFVVTQQVWRGIAGDAMAGRRQHRLEHGDRGTLAVGAGDGDDGARQARDIEAFADRADAAEAELDRARVQLFQPRQPAGQGVMTHRQCRAEAALSR